MARSGRGALHAGIDPIYFRLDRYSAGRNGQSREPARELRTHQPGLRDWARRSIGNLFAGLPRHGADQWNHPTDVRRTMLRNHAAAIVSSAAGAMASGGFEIP